MSTRRAVARSDELEHLCEQATRVAEVCEALGIEFRGARPLLGLLEGAKLKGVSLATMIENPDERPYIWDLKE